MKKFAETNLHKIIETPDVIAFFSTETGWNLKPFFEQYLKFTSIPALETKQNGTTFNYRWKNDVKDFELPISFFANKQKVKITPSPEWQSISLKKNAKIEFPTDLFYIQFK